MTFLLSHRALLRGMLVGAVVLAGTACSRSDRTESGSDTTAAILPDTSNYPASGADTAAGDTAAPAQSSSSTQPTTPAPSNSPRAETVPGDEDAAGYRSMERDTTDIPEQPSPDTSMSESSAVTSDSATVEMSASSSADTAATAADTSTAGYVAMARDTSTVADQAETAATSGDVALQTTVDTSSQDGAEVSTETDVAVNEAADDTAYETADEQIITAEDQETVAASATRTDEVGAAAIGGNVTGAEAVALTSREGVRCAVADPEANEAVRWDMSSTPVTLNPCGMGSMILSGIWTAGQQGSGAAGQ